MAARHCIVRDSSEPAELVRARRCSTVGTYLPTAVAGNTLIPATTPATATANAPARARVVHFLFDPGVNKAKVTDPTTAPSTRPTVLLLFCAYTRAREFTPAAAM